MHRADDLDCTLTCSVTNGNSMDSVVDVYIYCTYSAHATLSSCAHSSALSSALLLSILVPILLLILVTLLLHSSAHSSAILSTALLALMQLY